MLNEAQDEHTTQTGQEAVASLRAAATASLMLVFQREADTRVAPASLVWTKGIESSFGGLTNACWTEC